uniref:Uncharacterized protein n=1 Tax=Heterorhabditis bacteriophora TaxID=37862 RepID=A0A1I7XG96_HETBA
MSGSVARLGTGELRVFLRSASIITFPEFLFVSTAKSTIHYLLIKRH